MTLIGNGLRGYKMHPCTLNHHRMPFHLQRCPSPPRILPIKQPSKMFAFQYAYKCLHSDHTNHELTIQPDKEDSTEKFKECKNHTPTSQRIRNPGRKFLHTIRNLQRPSSQSLIQFIFTVSQTFLSRTTQIGMPSTKHLHGKTR